MSNPSLADLMLDPSDRAVVRAFVASWAEHCRPVLFAGAGLCKGAERKPTAPTDASFASWSELTERLRHDLSGGDENLAKRLPADYLRLAQLHETQHHRQLLLDRIAEAVPSDYFDPGETHRVLVRLPWAAAVTTNYDDLLERAFRTRRKVVKIVWDPDLTQPRRADDLVLIKMHGDLHDGRSIVLTEEDYRCYSHSRPGVTIKVKQLLLEHPLLFVGFSLTDPNFTNIDGWIRDTVGAVKLPGVALMRGPLLTAERMMWQRRGIHLVAVPDLTAFLRALERESSGGVSSPDRYRLSNEAVRIHELLSKRPKGWIDELAAQLARMPEEELGQEVRRVLDGRVSGICADDLRAALRALSAEDRKRILLCGYERGLVSIRGRSGSAEELSPDRSPAGPSTENVVLDVAESLLGDPTLIAEHRARVLLRRARVLRTSGDRLGAQRDIDAVGQLPLPRDLQERRDLERRELAWQLDDGEEMMRRLMEPPIEGSAYAYCRRASDALALADVKTASQLYRQALKLATNGDEKTSALMGMTICCDRWKETARVSQLEDERLAIRAEDRPRTERVWERRSKAGEELLRDRRTLAVDELERGITEGEEMGWPRSMQLSVNSLLDQLTNDFVRLQLAGDASIDEMKRALLAAVRNGRGPGLSVLSDEVVMRFASFPHAVAWLRELVTDRPKSLPFTRHSRDILASLCLQLLDDDSALAHIKRVFIEPTEKLSGPSGSEISDMDFERLEAHAEALSRSWWCMPRAIATAVLSATVRLFGPSWPFRKFEPADLPYGSWHHFGFLDEPLTRELLDKLIRVLPAEEVLINWPIRRMYLRTLHELLSLPVATADERSAVQLVLEQLMPKAMAMTGDRREGAILDLCLALIQFDDWLPSPELAACLIDLYGEIRNSTAARSWAVVVDRAGVTCPATHTSVLAENVREYVKLALANDEDRPLVHRAEWAAWMIGGVATRAPSIIPVEEAVTAIEGLAQRAEDCALVLADMGPSLGSEAAIQHGEDFILKYWMKPDSAHRDLVTQWCDQLHDAVPVTPAVEERLLARAVDHDPLQRARAFHVMSRLGAKGKLSTDAREQLLSVARRFGASDPHGYVRAGAARALALVDSELSQSVLPHLEALREDPAAPVRRWAELGCATLKSEKAPDPQTAP